MSEDISTWFWSKADNNEVESIEIIFFNSGNFVYIHTWENSTEADVDNASGQYVKTTAGLCFPLYGDIVTGKYIDNTMSFTFSDGEALGEIFFRK